MLNNILIIRGKDRHTQRMVWGFSAAKVNTMIADSLEQIPDFHVDVTLIDPSIDFDPSSKLKTNFVAFFDTEDDPRHFDASVGYHSLKDKVRHYVKMNWVDDDRGDGIKNIGFPIHILLECGHYARQEKLPWTDRHISPIMVAAPTYMGQYKPVPGGTYYQDECVSCFSFQNHRETQEPEIVYNQRYDWLLSLKKNRMPYVGGVNFSQGVYSLETQTEWHGNVEQFISPTGFISKSDQYKLFQIHKLALVPTGHERMSWRLFDAMAAGALIFWTDNCGQQSMYMPQSYVKIKDGTCLATTILANAEQFKEYWEASEQNRETLSKLTPTIIKKDFIKQFHE